jgi:hypothetical protein
MSNENKEQLPEWVMDIIDQHYPKISRVDCPDETTYLKAGVTRMFCIVYGKRVATEIYSRMQEENNKLREALEEIKSPINYMQKRLKEGEQLNGFYAIQLANDANYLRSIAASLIKDLDPNDAKNDYGRAM